MKKNKILMAIFLLLGLAILAVAFRRKFISQVPSPQSETLAFIYQCPMHPQIVQNEPGECPICHMSLQKVEQKPVLSETSKISPVPGHAPFVLSQERQQLIGVTTDTVRVRDLHWSLRTPGKVAYDPELYNAVLEYQEAARGERMARQGEAMDSENPAASLKKSMAVKLKLFGFSEAQIRDIETSGDDPSGLILSQKAAWVYAQVYENEANLIRPGQEAWVIPASGAKRRYHGRVKGIDPVINPIARTVRVRVQMDSLPASVRPESFAHVVFDVPLGKRLAVPEEAVMDTGEDQFVFVVKEGGSFDPRPVLLGREAEGFYEVLSGLEAGETVVTSANFLIDSESRFRSAADDFSRGHRHD